MLDKKIKLIVSLFTGMVLILSAYIYLFEKQEPGPIRVVGDGFYTLQENPSLESLTDTNLGLLSSGDYLYYDGVEWINSPGTSGTISLTEGYILVGNSSNEATATSTIYVNSSTGFVGIGTTTPAYRLDVYGNLRIDGNAIADDPTLDTHLVTLGYLSDAISQEVYTPTGTTTITTGVYNSGTIDSVQTLSDGDYFVVDEVTGVPGFDISWEFGSVEAINRVWLHVLYSGIGSHVINLDLYDYTNAEWDTLTTFTLTDDLQFIDFPVVDDTDYISTTGSSSVRVYHITSGNASHEISIDYVAIARTGFGTTRDHGDLTGLLENDHTQYLLRTDATTLYDVLGQATSTLLSHTSTYNHDNYNTAYGWGDHATAGYNLQSYASSTYVWASDWTTIDNYPIGCTNQFVRTIGDTLTCATVDISSDTNLVAGTNITLSADTLNVDDAFILNTGDTGTGVYDFGGATSFEIPNGTGGTVNADGEIYHDTTDDQLIVGADADVIRTEELIAAVTIASTSDFFSNINLPVPPEKDGYTVSRIACYVTGGTSMQVTLTDGTNAMDTLTCATTLTADDGTIANNTVTANELMELDPGTESGTVNYVSFSWYGYWTRE